MIVRRAPFACSDDIVSMSNRWFGFVQPKSLVLSLICPEKGEIIDCHRVKQMPETSGQEAVGQSLRIIYPGISRQAGSLRLWIRGGPERFSMPDTRVSLRKREYEIGRIWMRRVVAMFDVAMLDVRCSMFDVQDEAGASGIAAWCPSGVVVLSALPLTIVSQSSRYVLL